MRCSKLCTVLPEAIHGFANASPSSNRRMLAETARHLVSWPLVSSKLYGALIVEILSVNVQVRESATFLGVAHYPDT